MVDDLEGGQTERGQEGQSQTLGSLGGDVQHRERWTRRSRDGRAP